MTDIRVRLIDDNNKYIRDIAKVQGTDFYKVVNKMVDAFRLGMVTIKPVPVSPMRTEWILPSDEKSVRAIRI